MEAFDADAQLLPLWVQYWMNFIGLVLLVSTIAFVIRRDLRWAGIYLLVSTIIGVASMVWMHSQLGMVRLLGIVHIVFWPPIMFYLYRRLRQNPPTRLYTIIIWVVLVTMGVALVFDVFDVARYIAGQRAPVV